MLSCALPSPVASVPALSLEPVFRRSHGSLYKALDRGRIDQERLRSLLVAHRPKAWPLVFAVDASTWDRCDAECSPERGFYYSASRHSAGQPIVAGWNYQWICQLNWAFDSWTAPLDVMRIAPGQDASSPPSHRSARWSDFFQTLKKFRSSSSTPATTRSPWVTTSPRSVARCSRACVTTASFSPIPLHLQRGPREPWGVRRCMGRDSSARTRVPGPNRMASLGATDPRYGTVRVDVPGTVCTHACAVEAVGPSTTAHRRLSAAASSA